MADPSSDKTLEPTPHRRQQARENGQVAFSQDLGSAVLLVIGVMLVGVLGGAVVRHLAVLMQNQLGEVDRLTADPATIAADGRTILTGLGEVMLPVLGFLALAGLMTSLLQFGFLWIPGRVQPDFGRLSPFEGFRRIASVRSTMRFTFGLAKIAAVAAVAAAIVATRWQEIVHSSGLPLPELARFIAETVMHTVLWIGAALVVLAVFDYGFQRWKHEQDLRMTHQELREELRLHEGDPQLAARRRAAQQHVSRHEPI